MRAIFVEDIENLVSIKDDEAHHLINVIRVKIGDEILVLDGKGTKIYAQITDIKKNRIFIEQTNSSHSAKSDKIHLAIGLPKKEAFEEVLRNTTEMGISKIYYFKSQFFQQDFVFNERVKRVLISSLIQSNNPYFPDLEKLADLNSLISIFSQYDKIIYFCSHPNIPSTNFNLEKEDKILLIIGPEGGFSEAEENFLFKNSSLKVIHLPSFILRAPTAVVASMAWVMGKLS